MNVILYLHPVVIYSFLDLSQNNYSATNLFQVCSALDYSHISVCAQSTNP